MIHGSYNGEYYKLGEVGLQGGRVLGCFVAAAKKEATRRKILPMEIISLMYSLVRVSILSVALVGMKCEDLIVTQVTNNVNNANGGNGGNSGNDGNGGNNGCTYKGFMACNPKEYDGKRGAIALTRWIEKMENVIDNSGCAG
nr:reverse transcriptase domain-containing protein [Tanacetum cinerariifolium]